MMDQKRSSPLNSPEFLLVMIMLLILTLLVALVLFSPKLIAGGKVVPSAEEIFEYRKDILAIIIAAFGAWVGAGAAYFFGRENLRVATEGLLAMREKSPKERLREKKILEMLPRSLDWLVKSTDKLKDVLDKLKDNPNYWFIPIVKGVGDDMTLVSVIHEEAIWRYSVEGGKAENTAPDGTTDGTTTNPINTFLEKKTVEDLLTFIKKSDPKVQKKLSDINVVSNLDKSAAEVNEMMENKGVFLTIIVNEKGRPTHFITTGDIRSTLLQMS